MSCRPRCPRGNTPGYIIQSLRTLSQKLGFFTESEKGRQQLAIKRTIGQNILTSGYCVKPNFVDPDLHPEQGPVWRWIHDNDKDVFERFGDNYCKVGVGAGRKIDDRSMEEIRSIFEVTGVCVFSRTSKRARIKSEGNGIRKSRGRLFPRRIHD